MDTKKVSLRQNNRGAALITMVLMVLLVTGVLMMALNISGIESNLASTQRRTSQGLQAAEAGVSIAIRAIQDTLELNAIPTNPPNPATTKNYPPTIQFDCSNSNNANSPPNPATDMTLHDFVEEVRNGGGALANDSVTGNISTLCALPPLLTTPDPAPGSAWGPDIVAAALGYNLQIDIDLEGPANLPGSELEEFAIAYHKKVSGAGCGSGILYYIDVLAVGPMNNRSNVASAYFQC